MIDIHTHVDPDNVNLMLAIMDACHVETAVILCWPGTTCEVMKQAAVHSNRLKVFASVDIETALASDDSGYVLAQELLRHADQGAAGLKIYKNLGLDITDSSGKVIAVDDERLFPLWEQAGTLGLPVLIHTADPVEFWSAPDERNPAKRFLDAYPESGLFERTEQRRWQVLAQRNQLLKRFPQVCWIGAHFGGWIEDLSYLSMLFDTFPNWHLDLAACLWMLGRIPRGELSSFLLRYRERVILGTDLIIGTDADDVRNRALMCAHANQIYRDYLRFLTSNDCDIRHTDWKWYPVPLQGLGLTDSVAGDLVHANAERVLARRSAGGG